MKTSCVSVGFAGLSLAVALGFSAPAAASPSTENGSKADGQARIAETTQKLEQAFDEQFVKGQIDAAALAPLADDVINAMPEAARPRVQAHIQQVLEGGQKLASQLSSDQRAQMAAPTDSSKLTPTQIAYIGAWGWPSYGGWGNGWGTGWGGYGAFGWPSMYYGSTGCGFSAFSCGYGLGSYGWYW